MEQAIWKQVNMERIARELRLVRKQKGMTQKEFVEGTGMDFKTYSKYETGRYRPTRNEESFKKLIELHNMTYLINFPIGKNRNEIKPEWIPIDEPKKTKNETASISISMTTKNGTFEISKHNEDIKVIKNILDLAQIFTND